jgi:RNA polymerase sigma-70 factor, ECF subfamily
MEANHASDASQDSAVLVAAAKRGNTHAFEELVFRYEQRALAVALRITKNREDAEDVVQESFHKAFVHLHTFQQNSRFSTWLTRIAMNEAFMLLRRRRGIHEVLPDNPDDDAKSVMEAFADQSPTPEESYSRRERAEHLIKAINGLGPKTRTTILLRDIEERSLEETAQILGTSTAAVKARQFHGRRKLRRTMNPAHLSQVRSAARAAAQPCCA